LGCPFFLFLAGVAAALASSARLRRAERMSERDGKEETGARRASFAASTGMQWRGMQIFLLAFLFRVQAWVLSPGGPIADILKVDVLNIMGPAITGAALVWGLLPRALPRVLALAGVASLFGLSTPIVRSTASLAALPDPVEAYLRPLPGQTTFTLFPWAGFVFAGAAVGVLIDQARRVRDELRWRSSRGSGEAALNLRLGLAGAALAMVAFAASFLPSPYAQSSFWTSSPSFFFLRVGLLIQLVGLAYLWSQRTRWMSGRPLRMVFGRRAPALDGSRPGPPRYSPLEQFGRTSLFIYWVHVEKVYGVLAKPLHRNLTLPQTFVAFVLFTIAMLSLSALKTRVTDRSRDRIGRRAVDLSPASARG
jgi:uncharacterized membrane protein